MSCVIRIHLILLLVVASEQIFLPGYRDENCVCPDGVQKGWYYCGKELKEFNKLMDVPVNQTNCVDEAVYHCTDPNLASVPSEICGIPSKKCSMVTQKMEEQYWEKYGYKGKGQRTCAKAKEAKLPPLGSS